MVSDDPVFRVYGVVLPVIGGLVLRVLYLTVWFLLDALFLPSGPLHLVVSIPVMHIWTLGCALSPARQEKPSLKGLVLP